MAWWMQCPCRGQFIAYRHLGVCNQLIIQLAGTIGQPLFCAYESLCFVFNLFGLDRCCIGWCHIDASTSGCFRYECDDWTDVHPPSIVCRVVPTTEPHECNDAPGIQNTCMHVKICCSYDIYYRQHSRAINSGHIQHGTQCQPLDTWPGVLALLLSLSIFCQCVSQSCQSFTCLSGPHCGQVHWTCTACVNSCNCDLSQYCR